MRSNIIFQKLVGGSINFWTEPKSYDLFEINIENGVAAYARHREQFEEITPAFYRKMMRTLKPGTTGRTLLRVYKKLERKLLRLSVLMHKRVKTYGPEFSSPHRTTEEKELTQYLTSRINDINAMFADGSPTTFEK